MKIVTISDTHGLHRDLKLDGGDVLIHAGDCTRGGNTSDTMDFFDWFSIQMFRHKILVPGNHDFIFEHPVKAAKIRGHFPDVHVLMDSGVNIEGCNFWGSPWSLPFYDWAFMKTERELEVVWDLIPDNTNFLITHGPALNILDQVDNGDHVGSSTLLKKINQLKYLNFHVTGHIHEAYGEMERKGVLHFNSSVLNSRYQLINKPHVMEF